jgi:hypothetical protein
MTTHDPYEARPRPCPSCPYRADAPSGIWARVEYEKLTEFDGSIGEQAINGAMGLFMCHNTPTKLCSGWLATHGPDNLLALRIQHERVSPDVFDYTTDVAVHTSGQAAHDHGVRDLDAPSPAAMDAVEKIMKVRPDAVLFDSESNEVL